MSIGNQYGNLTAVLTAECSITGQISGQGTLTGQLMSAGNQYGNLTAVLTAECSITGQISGQGTLTGQLSAIIDDTKAYILVTEDGTEIPAVMVDEEVVFTATENDIRRGTVAATESGVTVGEKFIPAYQTEEGYKRVATGKELTINMYSDQCQYTRLQVIVCAYNTNSQNSVAAEMVVINDKLYHVRSVDEIATVTVDIVNQSIKLGIYNDSDNYLVIRYFTYRED